MRKTMSSRSRRLAAGALAALVASAALSGCTVVERDRVRFVDRGPYWVPGHWVPRGGYYWRPGYWR